jgi:hypothetical protein
MQFLGVGLALSIVSTLPLLADQPIEFSNAGLGGGAGRLVFFGSTMGRVHGQPVVNGVADGINFVAQLFLRNVAGDFSPVGPIAEFGDGTTTPAGTWLGGIRTIEGVERGVPLQLVVVAWDANFADPDTAFTHFGAAGASGVFGFQDKMSNPPQPSDIAMDSFQSFQIGGLAGLPWRELPWGPRITPEPSTVGLAAVGLITLLWLPKKSS